MLGRPAPGRECLDRSGLRRGNRLPRHSQRHVGRAQEATTNIVAADETPWAANSFISARWSRTRSAERRRATIRATFCGRTDDQLIKLQDRTESHEPSDSATPPIGGAEGTRTPDPTLPARQAVVRESPCPDGSPVNTGLQRVDRTPADLRGHERIDSVATTIATKALISKGWRSNSQPRFAPPTAPDIST